MARGVSERRVLVILFCSLILMGCREKSEQQDNGQAAEAIASLPKIRTELTKARREIADLKEELRAVKDIRDELDKLVAQMAVERDNALKAATSAEQEMKDLTAQLGEMPDSLRSLETELNHRNELIESQQATIAEQQAAIAEQQAIITEQEAAIADLEKIIQEQPQPVELEEVPESET